MDFIEGSNQFGDKDKSFKQNRDSNTSDDFTKEFFSIPAVQEAVRHRDQLREEAAASFKARFDADQAAKQAARESFGGRLKEFFRKATDLVDPVQARDRFRS